MAKKLTIIILSIFLCMVFFTFIGSPSLLPVFASNSSSFSVSLTVDNVLPTITSVDNISASPTVASTNVVSFYFNASDSNGIGDIPADNAQLFIYRQGVIRNATVCTNVSDTGTEIRYECNLTIFWNDAPGPWSINVSIFDGSGTKVYDNDKGTLTMGTTYGIAVTPSSLTFSGDPGQADVSASNNPLVVNNTGNGNFTEFTITAYDLKSGAKWITAESFTANVTPTATGTELINDTAVTIPNTTMVLNTTREVYIYVTIPEGANGTYTSLSDWVLTAG